MKSNHGNGYFADPAERPQHPHLDGIDDIIEELGLVRLAALALAGQLTEYEVIGTLVSNPGASWRQQSLDEDEIDRRLTRMGTKVGRPHLTSLTIRRWWTTHVGWAMFTIEYQESLRQLLKALGAIRVHEVAAGRAPMRHWFTEQGFNWKATDAHPVDDDIEQYPALEAAKQAVAGDVLFASWVPMRSGEEDCLARQLAQLGRPLILVGEGEGGCTGSERFWRKQERYTVYDIGGFRDVPQWYGLHDYTVLALPDGFNPLRVVGFTLTPVETYGEE